MNSVNMIGRLGKDPELKYSTNGTAVCKFGLAVNRDKDTTDWFDCVAFKQTAEMVSSHLAKGSQCGISGRLQARTWEAQDGTKRKAVEIVVDRITFCGTKADAKPADDEDPFGGE